MVPSPVLKGASDRLWECILNFFFVGMEKKHYLRSHSCHVIYSGLLPAELLV